LGQPAFLTIIHPSIPQQNPPNITSVLPASFDVPRRIHVVLLLSSVVFQRSRTKKKKKKTHPIQELELDLITDSSRNAVRGVRQRAIDTDLDLVDDTEGRGGYRREKEEGIDELHFAGCIVLRESRKWESREYKRKDKEVS
jgi:hypothetical protein